MVIYVQDHGLIPEVKVKVKRKGKGKGKGVLGNYNFIDWTDLSKQSA